MNYVQAKHTAIGIAWFINLLLVVSCASIPFLASMRRVVENCFEQNILVNIRISSTLVKTLSVLKKKRGSRL